MNNWRDDKPTYKQLNYIKELEDEYGCSFTGTTKGEASDFINTWAEHDRKRRELDGFYQECLHGEAGDRI